MIESPRNLPPQILLVHLPQIRHGPNGLLLCFSLVVFGGLAEVTTSRHRLLGDTNRRGAPPAPGSVEGAEGVDASMTGGVR
jgi:hypothetical protein